MYEYLLVYLNFILNGKPAENIFTSQNSGKYKIQICWTKMTILKATFRKYDIGVIWRMFDTVIKG